MFERTIETLWLFRSVGRRFAPWYETAFKGS